MKLTNYTRRPFSVDAVQVTAENIFKISDLCGGQTFDAGEQTNKSYIVVPVKRPANARQTRAYIGDWVVFHQNGWKVYTNKAFTNTFQSTVEVSNDLHDYVVREVFGGATNDLSGLARRENGV